MEQSVVLVVFFYTVLALWVAWVRFATGVPLNKRHPGLWGNEAHWSHDPANAAGALAAYVLTPVYEGVLVVSEVAHDFAALPRGAL